MWITSLALVLACAVPAARAQALAVQVPYGLAGSDAWRENIALGIDIWVIAHENARRALLLDRCTALDQSFPERPAPAMVAASTEVFRWITGEAHRELPPEPFSAATRDVLPVLARQAFSPEELASWASLRNSPEGRRGLALHEVEVAIVKSADQLVNVSSGRSWSWPLARLTRLADTLGLRPELDAAFETAIGTGAAARLRGISLVPGESPADTGFEDQVLRSGDSLGEAFIEGLTPSDHAAYERVGRSEVLRSWTAITQALPRFAMGPTAAAMLRESRPPATVAEFCDSVGLSSCQPSGELHSAISRYTTAFNEAARSGATVNSARRIVRALPSSGCP
jgi:hypothetical protein